MAYFNPLGEYGFVMKRTAAIELSFMGTYDEDLRMRMSLGFARPRPRLDSFPVTTYFSGGGHELLLPGTQVFHSSFTGFMTSGIDWNVINREPVFVYPGLDFIAGLLVENYETNYPTYSVPHEEEFTSVFFGLRARLGIMYVVNQEWAFSLEATRSGYIATELGPLAHWDIGIGISYVW